MPLNYLNGFIAVLGLLCFSCSDEPHEKPQPVATRLLQKDTLKYAERFAIEKGEGFNVVHVFGNRADADTTATYVIGTNLAVMKGFPKRAVFIKAPCQKIAALSSIYATIISDLGALDRLVAIDNADYTVNPQLLAKYRSGQLIELAKGPEPDLEQTITLRPDIIFTFGMGRGKDVNPKLEQSGIPVAVSLDHLEKTPLARAEWIKFYAAFIGKERLADSLFRTTEKKYRELQALAKHATWAPAVFNEVKYGDTWYVPGGKSYVAELLQDAGASYVWKDDPNTGSLQLSFEQVYAKARNADFWINLSMVRSKAELLGQEPRYSEFKAFKTNHLYNNNKVTNDKGYSTYWETGMVYPERILSDLIFIFHPELMPEMKNDLYYYQLIN